MERSEQLTLTAGIGVVGAIVFLGLTVYPFKYGPVESGVLAGLLVLAGVVEFVLDEGMT